MEYTVWHKIIFTWLFKILPFGHYQLSQITKNPLIICRANRI